MNTKISLLLVLILLIVLMLFYYVDLESNIIILLGVTIVILIHNVIIKREHFSNLTVNERTAQLDAKLDTLLAIAEALQQRSGQTTSEPLEQGLAFEMSCPFTINNNIQTAAPRVNISDTGQGLNLGFGTTLDGISAENLLNAATGQGDSGS